MDMAKKNKGISQRAIRAMPYESRIIHYNREKDEMFRRNAGLPASELQRMHDELTRKWDV